MLSLNVGLRISSGPIFQASAWFFQWTGIRREWTWGGRHLHRAKFTHRPSRDPLGIQNSRVDHLGRDDTGRITTQGTDAKGCRLRRMVRTISPLLRLMIVVPHLGHVSRGLFRDPKFVLLFVGSGIATFPLLVPPSSSHLVVCRAGLGSKPRAWARLCRARAHENIEPGPGRGLGLGSGWAWA